VIAKSSWVSLFLAKKFMLYFAKPLVRLMLLSLLSLGAIACNPAAINQTNPATTTSEPPKPKEDPVVKQLLGEWEAENQAPVNGKTSERIPTIFFSNDGKGYFIGSSDGKKQAIAFKYLLKSDAKPMQIDLILTASPKPVETIFEITSDGKLRLETQSQPGNPRPTSFSQQTIKLKKIYDQPTLPADVSVIDTDPMAAAIGKGEESEGKNNLKSISRAQQAYYLEKAQFSNKLDDLGLGIKPDTENYRYKIAIAATNQVVIAAQAKKPQLKSFTGVVIAEKPANASAETTLSFACETEQASTTPPTVGSITRSVEFQCPIGSRRVK
jgi:uncharacterized protein (TIGR03067 family)